jgi:hypothetical protein
MHTILQGCACTQALFLVLKLPLLQLLILQVRGKSGVYITFAKTYCSCQAHYYEVVCKSEAPYVSLSLAGADV